MYRLWLVSYLPFKLKMKLHSHDEGAPDELEAQDSRTASALEQRLTYWLNVPIEIERDLGNSDRAATD
jgi:hypothetical protein